MGDIRDVKLSNEFKELKKPTICTCGCSNIVKVDRENDGDYGYECYYKLKCIDCNTILAEWAYGWFEWTISEGFARPNDKRLIEKEIIDK